MSTTSLLRQLQKEYPLASRDVLLDILVSCNGDVGLAKELLGQTLPQKHDTKDSPKRQASIAGFGVKKRKTEPKLDTSPSKPLTLYTPEDIEANLPCSLIYNVLDKTDAEGLLDQLLDDEKSWRQKTQFYLFDKLCETPHKSAFYTKDMSVYSQHTYRYNGRPVDTSRKYSPAMEACSDRIQELVRKTEREGTSQWLSDACIANFYADESQSVGFHSDQLTYIGPRPVIAALTLGSERIFRLKGVLPDGDRRTYNVLLPHNSLMIMHAGCQEAYKHSIIPVQAKQIGLHERAGKARFSLTFRHYKKEFTPNKIPQCKCGEPMILKPVFKKAAGQKSDYFWTCGQTYQGKGCGSFEWYDKKV
ncbi:Alpha-ketoglutarate-dependent dioxygenase alkB-like protein 3 [Yarrowia sp. B02]|nr:Alpha-ketoglutarate-dependent dioxygenase alkB-like protein 3 [Yarrowia sp. B02]